MNRPFPLDLDLLGRRRRGSLIGWLMLLGATVFLVVGALDWQAAREDAARWSAKAGHWQDMAVRLGGGRKTGSDEAAVLQPQVVAATKAIRSLVTPWGGLYRSLEGSIDDSVSLLAISPNVNKGEIRLNGEAKDFAALRSYLKRLAESEALSDVRLLGQEVKHGDAQHPIVFSIVATWRKAS